DLGLFPDVRRDPGFERRIETAGVDDQEVAPLPLRHAVETVARDPRLILDDRLPRSHESIEERGLADVRPSHDRHELAGHVPSGSRYPSCSSFSGSLLQFLATATSRRRSQRRPVNLLIRARAPIEICRIVLA